MHHAGAGVSAGGARVDDPGPPALAALQLLSMGELMERALASLDRNTPWEEVLWAFSRRMGRDWTPVSLRDLQSSGLSEKTVGAIRERVYIALESSARQPSKDAYANDAAQLYRQSKELVKVSRRYTAALKAARAAEGLSPAAAASDRPGSSSGSSSSRSWSGPRPGSCAGELAGRAARLVVAIRFKVELCVADEMVPLALSLALEFGRLGVALAHLLLPQDRDNLEHFAAHADLHCEALALVDNLAALADLRHLLFVNVSGSDSAAVTVELALRELHLLVEAYIHRLARHPRDTIPRSATSRVACSCIQTWRILQREKPAIGRADRSAAVARHRLHELQLLPLQRSPSATPSPRSRPRPASAGGGGPTARVPAAAVLPASAPPSPVSSVQPRRAALSGAPPSPPTPRPRSHRLAELDAGWPLRQGPRAHVQSLGNGSAAQDVPGVPAAGTVPKAPSAALRTDDRWQAAECDTANRGAADGQAATPQPQALDLAAPCVAAPESESAGLPHDDAPPFEDEDEAMLRRALKASALEAAAQQEEAHVLVTERQGSEALVQKLSVGNTGQAARLLSLTACFPQYRAVAGDGNCFYRAFAYGLLEHLMVNSDQALQRHLHDVVSSLDVNNCLPLAVTADEHVLAKAREGKAVLVSLLQGINRYASMVESHQLHASLCNHKESDAIVQFLRVLTATEMLADADSYAPFASLPVYEGLSIREICRRHVVPMAQEVEHLQVVACCRALGVDLAILYAAGEGDIQVYPIQGSADLLPGQSQASQRPLRLDCGAQTAAVWLVYLGGHYELVYPESH